MKWLLLLAAVIAGPLQGEEAAPLRVREKLRARIVESLPPPPPAGPADRSAEPEGPVLVLEPIRVSEARGVRELERLLVSETQRKKDEAFSPGKGGALYRSERLELGGWWSPESGWQFLKLKW